MITNIKGSISFVIDSSMGAQEVYFSIAAKSCGKITDLAEAVRGAVASVVDKAFIQQPPVIGTIKDKARDTTYDKAHILSDCLDSSVCAVNYNTTTKKITPVYRGQNLGDGIDSDYIHEERTQKEHDTLIKKTQIKNKRR